ARVAELLGEQSVSNVIVAVAELVKNSYDADAKKVKVIFQKTDDKQLRLIIEEEEGDGMTLDDLKNKWMVIGTDDKVTEKFSNKGRRKVGEKGIGRFAIQRLGDKLEMIVKPRNTNDLFIVKIDWDKYRQPGTTFDQVENDLLVEKRNDLENSGTTIIIDKLRDNWSKPEIELLSRELKSIVPPSWQEDQFAIIVDAPHVGIYNTKLDSSLLQHAAYEIHCEYHENGTLDYNMLLAKKEHGKNSVQQKDLDATEAQHIDLGKLKCGPMKFSFYYFPLGPSGEDKKLAPYVLKDNLLRRQLRANHGVKIFRDNFMVKPYGEPGNDWLGLNQMIVTRRDTAFSNNTVIGIVEINRDKNPLLLDTTTREGLIKNEAFYDLKTLIMHCVRILIKRRSQDFGDKIPELYQSPAMKKISNAARRISQTATSKDKLIVQKALLEFQQGALEMQAEIMNEINMYRGLASLGISVAAIAHEIGESIGAILQRTKYVLSVLKERPLTYGEHKTITEHTLNDILKIREFISFAAVFTTAEERQKSYIRMGDVVKIVLDAYLSVFKDQFITVEKIIAPDLVLVNGYRVDFEAILINLVTNSIEVLRGKQNERKIRITCKNSVDGILIRFSDSGDGIPVSNREIIFEPFWTSKKEGTGLGLSIINEIVKGYDGTITVVNSEIGNGATFEIRITRGGVS
ncbi:MAG: ATP-binding protein, partial [Nitrosotalea sp.]